MRKHTLTGNIKVHRAFPSKFLGNRRDILVYLPPGYRRFSWRRHSVLYLHDGQNIFDASTSFGGVEWGVDETADQLIRNGQMDEVIIVGLYNTGANRLYEYTPCCDPTYGGGGADSYEKFIIDTVKPYIDRGFRTIPKREDTALMGSSLGGLLSFYMGWTRSDIFSRVAS